MIAQDFIEQADEMRKAAEAAALLHSRLHGSTPGGAPARNALLELANDADEYAGRLLVKSARKSD